MLVRPLVRPLVRSLVRGLQRGAAAYNPLSDSPYIYMDASTGVLKTGGAPAGYLDGVAAWSNPGSASDAVQLTSASQPTYLPYDPAEGAYLHTPGVAGNSASVPHSANLNPAGDYSFILTLESSNLTQPYVRFLEKLENFWIRSLPDVGNFDVLLNGTYQHFFTGVNPAIGQIVQLRVSVDVDNGAGGHACSVDYRAGTSGVWTTAGTNTQAGVLAQSGSTSPVEIANGFRGAIHRAQLFGSLDGTDERLDINFANVPDGATSFIAATGQTVTINSTGNNPAQVIGMAGLRTDGVDDFLTGTFASAVTGARMFMVFRVLGDGGQNFSGLFGTLGADLGTDNSTPKGAAWGVKVGSDLVVQHDNGSYGYRTGGFVGKHLWEVAITSNSVITVLDNDTPVTNAHVGTLASTLFHIAERAGYDNYRAAIQLHHLSLFPANMPAASVTKMRALLNKRFNLGLVIPPYAPSFLATDSGGYYLNSTNGKYQLS